MTRPPVASRNAATKPTVLLVDDHRDILNALSRMLSRDFNVVDVATEGREALDKAERLDPDLVVLDVTMAGLNGFQTARELTRRGSRSRVMFLTMHDTEDFVAEGFRSGGRGYVLKHRVHEDLVRAIRSVLAGQIFAPSLRSLFALAADDCKHSAQLYEDDETLVDGVSKFLAMALRRGDAVSVVMKKHIRADLAASLRAHGCDVDRGEDGRYFAFDPADALSSIMRGGCPDRNLLARIVDNLERARLAVADGSAPRHTVVGEIAVQLFSKGDVEAGMEIERLWNELTHALPIHTLCCYPASCIDAHPADVFTRVCGEHWALA